VGLCWLVLPWNAAASFWLTAEVRVLTIGMEALLCVLLIRGWEKDRSNALLAGVLYLWMCLSYEAFYFQWVPIILLGIVLWKARRATLRAVAGSAMALLAAQGAAGLWHIYNQWAGYWTAKSVLPDWRQRVYHNFLNLPVAAFQSVSEIYRPVSICALIVIVVLLWVLVRSLLRTSDRLPLVVSASVLGAALVGGLASVVVFTLGGRTVAPTGVETRTLMIFNFWLLTAFGVLVIFAMERLAPAPKLTFGVALAGLGLCLAIGHFHRAQDWAEAWNLQKKLLAETPVSELERTELNARIIILNQTSVNGAPIFGATWDINSALPWAYPFLRTREFVLYNPWQGPLKWDGKELSYADQSTEPAAAVYVWRASDRRFWQPAGHFVVNQDLTVQPLQ
jgi:hypothetical protein